MVLLVQLDFEHVADFGAGVEYGVRRQFENGCRFDNHRGDAPRAHVLFHLHHAMVAVEVDDVNGIAHEHGVDAVAGLDPERASGLQGRARRSHQTHESLEVSVGHAQFRRHKCLAGEIECVPGFAVCRVHRFRSFPAARKHSGPLQ